MSMITLRLVEQETRLDLTWIRAHFSPEIIQPAVFNASIYVDAGDTSMPWKTFVQARQAVLAEVSRLFGTMMQDRKLVWFFSVRDECIYLPTMDDATLVRMSVDF